jgi:spore coat protein B
MIRKQMNSQLVESNAYLKSLVGKKVKVYRGGPESCEGRLLDVQSDYVALMPEESNDNSNNNNNNAKNDNSKNDNSIIYYNLRHVQSISENLKANSVESNLRLVQNIVQHINENIYSNLKHVQSISENLIANLKHVQSINKNSNTKSVEANLKPVQSINKNSNTKSVEANLKHVQSISENLIANLKHVQSINKNSNTKSVEANLKPVQSISENLIANSVEQSIAFDDLPELVSANDFTQLLKKLTGSTIKVNQGGPESKKGIVLIVAGDYMGLLTEDDGIVFYNTTHIKSVSVQNLNQNIEQNIDQSTPFSNSPIFNEINFDDIHAQNFLELFDYFAYKWVSINRGGPEASEGILVQEEGEHYTLVNNEEVIRIYPYHIKSISIGSKGFLKQQQQQQNNETDENGNAQDGDMTNKREDDRTSDKDRRTKVEYEVKYDSTSDKDHRKKVENNKTSDKDHHTSRKSSTQEKIVKETKETIVVEDDRTSDRDHSPQEKIVKETIVKTIDYVWDPDPKK